MDIAPLFQLDHHRIIRSFLIGCRHPHHRQPQRTKKTVLKVVCGTVGADFDIRANDRSDLFPDAGHLFFRLLLPLGHIVCIDRNTVKFHDA